MAAISEYTVDWEGEHVRIAVIGGGPGGLYFAYLWKRRHPDAQIDLFEQNPEGATWGFGVVFSEQALEFLRADDPETVDAIAPRMESWNNITLNLHGESVETRRRRIFLDRPTGTADHLAAACPRRRRDARDTTRSLIPSTSLETTT